MNKNKLKYRLKSLIYFPNEDYQKYFQTKLKEFNQVRKCYAHEKTQTTTNVVQESNASVLGM
jgi:hypothetical protein